MSVDVRTFTVGPVQENCFILRREGSKRAIVVDPGEEAARILAAVEEFGIEVEAILVTHCHFDHIGAVAPVAASTGAHVYVSEIERPVLADIASWTPVGFGPFESYRADHSLHGGETLDLATFKIDVLHTPGHSPGHLTYSLRDEQVIFSGDVLFQGSVGRTDLPGGEWETLLKSIKRLVDSHSPETVVYPGHMGMTTLGKESATNPFLAELTG